MYFIYIKTQLEHSSNLHFVNLELKMPPVTMWDCQTLINSRHRLTGTFFTLFFPASDENKTLVYEAIQQHSCFFWCLVTPESAERKCPKIEKVLKIFLQLQRVIVGSNYDLPFMYKAFMIDWHYFGKVKYVDFLNGNKHKNSSAKSLECCFFFMLHSGMHVS